MKGLLDDGLWERIRPHLPAREPSPKGGRPRKDDRACLAGILLALVGGVPWEMLPGELGVSGMTCWRRLRDWQAAGAWDAAWRSMLDELGRAGRLDLTRAAADAFHVPAKRGAAASGPTRATGGGREARATS